MKKCYVMTHNLNELLKQHGEIRELTGTQIMPNVAASSSLMWAQCVEMVFTEYRNFCAHK